MCSEHSLSTLFVKVSGDRLVNALQPQWVALVLHTRTCCSYLFRLAALWKKRKKKTVIFGTFLSACIASDIEISCSLFHSYVSRPTFRETQFHLVNRSLVLNSCVSLGILDGFTSLTRPWRWTKTTRWRKEGRKASRQAGRKEGRQAVTLQSQRKRNYVPLSCLLAFKLLAHDESVLCSTLATRVLVGTSSRRFSHPRVRFAHVNNYKGSLRPHMLKPTIQLSRSIVSFEFCVFSH